MHRTPPDDYYVLMWNFMSPLFSSGAEIADRAIARFRELACNGATLIASYVDHAHYRETYRVMGLGEVEHKAADLSQYRYLENNLPFYVMNLCPALYMNWSKGKPLFHSQFEQFERDHDRKVFIRRPCVNDPVVRKAAIDRVARVMEGLAPMRHLSLLYDVRDEPSVTSFILASDVCFCEHCMGRMRTWLRERYADLAALNAEWGTRFASWDDVEPITTQEALERRETGDWNFAPWSDHREFCNTTFAGICADLRQEVLRHDPDALVGPTGTQCPSIYGGYDFSKLIPVSDWIEAYDFGNSVDCCRSFKPRRAYPIIKTDFCKAPAATVDAMLWTYVLQSGGYGGTIIWESNMMLDVAAEDHRPTETGRQHGAVFAELRSGLPRLLQRTEEISSPVAVHYSHASINADFITAVPPRWRSVAAYEAERFPAFGCRMAWWKLLEDRGLRPVFLSSAQIEAGELGRRGVKLLVLPRSIAISDAEAAAMRQFVAAGGVLAADGFAGRMDEHCREREVGALDDLFGLRRLAVDAYHGSNQRASLDWAAAGGARPKWGAGPLRAECSLIEERVEPVEGATVMGCAEYSDSPLGFRAEHGKGVAVLFNAAPLEYLHARRSAAGGVNFQQFFGHIVDLAGLAAEAEAFDPATGNRLPGWRAWSFAHGAARYFGLAPDLAVSQDVLGGLTGGVGEGGGRKARVKLAAAGHVYEARTGRYLGEGDAFDDQLAPTVARIYAVLPYRVTGVELTFDGQVARASVQATAAAGEHVLRFDVLNANGQRLLDAGANVVAESGKAEWRPAAALAAGSKIVCRDVATGVSATC